MRRIDSKGACDTPRKLKVLAALVLATLALSAGYAQAAGAAASGGTSPLPSGTPAAAAGVFRYSDELPSDFRDPSGFYLGATETMRILPYKGKLFASTGCWMDLPYLKPKGTDPWTGPKILVKDGYGLPWRVEKAFPASVRVDGLFAARFTTYADGSPMPPVDMLIAGPSSPREAKAWTRDDSTGEWTATTGFPSKGGGIRSFGMHRDAVTGISHIFAGAARGGGIYRGSFDPAVPGRIRWAEEPELSGTGRVMCMAEADGKLYIACGIADDPPHEGGLYVRQDGREPSWKRVWQWPYKTVADKDESEIARGLTAIRGADGRDTLLCTAAYPGVVYRIEPSKDHAVTVELDIKAYFAKAWGRKEYRGPALSAYNDMVPYRLPSGEDVLLFGAAVGPGDPAPHGAWFLIRHSGGTYSHEYVPVLSGKSIESVRTIAVSPFPEEPGAIYLGGYDCASRESHNTAWIYRAMLPEGL